MSKTQNTVESQDEVTRNQGMRTSNVLISAISKCQTFENSNKKLKEKYTELLKKYEELCYISGYDDSYFVDDCKNFIKNAK